MFHEIYIWRRPQLGKVLPKFEIYLQKKGMILLKLGRYFPKLKSLDYIWESSPNITQSWNNLSDCRNLEVPPKCRQQFFEVEKTSPNVLRANKIINKPPYLEGKIYQHSEGKL